MRKKELPGRMSGRKSPITPEWVKRWKRPGAHPPWKIDEALIRRIARTIVEHFDPLRIVLFGSFARGDAGPESDLDLLVVMETREGPTERAVAIRRLFGLHPWPMDILVYTPGEVRRLRRAPWTVPSIAETEGRVLYERG